MNMVPSLSRIDLDGYSKVNALKWCSQAWQKIPGFIAFEARQVFDTLPAPQIPNFVFKIMWEYVFHTSCPKPARYPIPFSQAAPV